MATKALANGGVRLVGGVQAESWKKTAKKRPSGAEPKSRRSIPVDRHRHQDRCQCHQEPDRDGSHYPQRQPSGEEDRLVVADPASCRTTPTPTWITFTWQNFSLMMKACPSLCPPPPMGVCPSTCHRSQNSLDEALPMMTRKGIKAEGKSNFTLKRFEKKLRLCYCFW